MISKKAAELIERLRREAGEAGYLLNPDEDFVSDLMEGLVTNQERYGYPACPCRLAEGERAEDLDIICPCDYRDRDLDEHGACYCALYVSEEVSSGERKLRPVPERRGEAPRSPGDEVEERSGLSGGSMPVWRCKVCGYLCARDAPPGKCPICKADRDRFERFA